MHCVQEDYVVVVDDQPNCQEQISVLRNERMNGVELIRCDDDDNKSNPVCAHADGIPMFCSKTTGGCVTGLRRTRDELDQLCNMSDTWTS